jgi:hypothetical protein
MDGSGAGQRIGVVYEEDPTSPIGQPRSQPNLGLGERGHGTGRPHGWRSHVASVTQIPKGRVFLRNTACVG